MFYYTNCQSFAEIDAKTIDQSSVVCHLFFTTRIPISHIARILGISQRQVETSLMMAFERLLVNHSAIVVEDVFSFASPTVEMDF